MCRTLDPDQADLFYVPVYTSCFFHPVLGWADFPFWYGNGGEAQNNENQTYGVWGQQRGGGTVMF